MWLCRTSAPTPKIKDIGILASTDPVSIDQAEVDLIELYKDDGTEDLLNQIRRLKGKILLMLLIKMDLVVQNIVL